MTGWKTNQLKTYLPLKTVMYSIAMLVYQNKNLYATKKKLLVSEIAFNRHDRMAQNIPEKTFQDPAVIPGEEVFGLKSQASQVL